jgi:hypothetical protein
MYEDSINEFDKFVSVSASWADAIRYITHITDKAAYYWDDPDWDDTTYMMRYELMPYKRKMMAGLEDEPTEHFSTTTIARVEYEDDLYGNMIEYYYIRVAEI